MREKVTGESWKRKPESEKASEQAEALVTGART
jgi:hypothetical protein